MNAESVSETLHWNFNVTLLTVEEDFNVFSRHEVLKSHSVNLYNYAKRCCDCSRLLQDNKNVRSSRATNSALVLISVKVSSLYRLYTLHLSSQHLCSTLRTRKSIEYQSKRGIRRHVSIIAITCKTNALFNFKKKPFQFSNRTRILKPLHAIGRRDIRVKHCAYGHIVATLLNARGVAKLSHNYSLTAARHATVVVAVPSIVQYPTNHKIKIYNIRWNLKMKINSSH
jgi:hypothetical protein